MLNGDGSDFLECFRALTSMRRGSDEMVLVDRIIKWLEQGASGRRSINALAYDRSEREAFARMGEADPREIEIGALRAQREMSDEPLRMRVGVTEVEKQAVRTDDIWRASDLARQRGASRARSGSLMIGTSKNAGDPVLPGPTAVIGRNERPDEAMSQIAAAIWEADPEARIIDVDFDHFDSCLSQAQAEEGRPSFVLRVPCILRNQSVQSSGPMALYLRPTPSIDNVSVHKFENVRDVKGLRVGRRGAWSQSYLRDIERVDDFGALEAEPVQVRVSEPLMIGTSPHSFFTRVVHVAAADRSDSRASADARLVAVVGEDDEEEIVSLALTVLSLTDEHPRIAQFIEARRAARVFRGEQQTRNALHVDRALAGVAFAAYLLDQRQPAAAAH